MPAATASTPRSSSYRVGRPRGICHATGETIHAGDTYVGVLRETPEGFERFDYLPAAWETLENPQKSGVLAFWHGTMPAEASGEEDKIAIDDEVLVELLNRLENAEASEKIAFRFVVGLMLMRSRRLTFLGNETTDDGHDVWHLRFRGGDRQEVRLLDPKLGEAELQAASDRVSRLLTDGVDRSMLEGDADEPEVE